MKKNTEEHQTEYERCVVCHRLTNIPVDLPIAQRKTYVVGAGQLCKDCCIRLYHTEDLRDGSYEES